MEYTLPLTGFELITLLAIGIDWTGSCKSNYYTITTTTAPKKPIRINLFKLDITIFDVLNTLTSN